MTLCPYDFAHVLNFGRLRFCYLFIFENVFTFSTLISCTNPFSVFISSTYFFHPHVFFLILQLLINKATSTFGFGNHRDKESSSLYFSGFDFWKIKFQALHLLVPFYDVLFLYKNYCLHFVFYTIICCRILICFRHVQIFFTLERYGVQKVFGVRYGFRGFFDPDLPMKKVRHTSWVDPSKSIFY